MLCYIQRIGVCAKHRVITEEGVMNSVVDSEAMRESSIKAQIGLGK